ncbi:MULTISPECIES: hypothetical protein [unclassified Pseudofrankia]|uniref:hypothetical protein n=1 Tax=unclassified Pseudofrankia TaxID=2994372 RepID=UPI000A6C1B02|nr:MULTISPECIES: hypothetical protein [unclassified Pseudofrankia]MDT3442097.1 hypothetical protein [Pseudofrankia sp. BMG5.37]
MPDDRGPHHQEDPDHMHGALRRGDGARLMARSVVGRRFFLADPRSQTAPGRTRLTEIADELADPAAAARWYRRLNLGPLVEVAAPHDRIAQLLAGDPPAENAGTAGRRVRAELEARRLGWLRDNDERLAHAQRAWDGLYAAHHGVAEAVAQVEPLSNVLRVCRLAELAYSASEPDWRELADAAAARPMVPAEIYRSQRERRLRPPDHVVQAVAVPGDGGELGGPVLSPAALTSCAEET